MQFTLSTLLFSIFTILGLIHINWALGGKRGLEAALPVDANGERTMNPRKVDSAVVGIGLLVFGTFYLLQSGLVSAGLPEQVWQYGNWIVPIIFVLRAVGDFKYLGFFKKVKNTKFAKWDTLLFSPLCAAIGMMAMTILMIR